MLDQDLLDLGLKFHGHKCPAMPMGLRTGLAAMNALGVEHAADGQLVALVEIDEDHCATCFADGVQVATGCTLGKGNIRRLGYGKTSHQRFFSRSERSTPPWAMFSKEFSLTMTTKASLGMSVISLAASVSSLASLSFTSCDSVDASMVMTGMAYLPVDPSEQWVIRS
jgi:hypothetical protein